MKTIKRWIEGVLKGAHETSLALQETSLLSDSSLRGEDLAQVVRRALASDWPDGMPASLARDLLTEHRQRCLNLNCVTRGVYCMAGSDGDCDWEWCPQNRDGEPMATGRDCPRVWSER